MIYCKFTYLALIMAEFHAEAFVILLAQRGSQTAVAAAMQCSQAAVSRKLKAARELLGDSRALELIQQYQRDDACGVTLRKPFIMGTSICGVCGGAKTAQPSGKLRCNHCRNAKYLDAHPNKDVDASYVRLDSWFLAVRKAHNVPPPAHSVCPKRSYQIDYPKPGRY